jgi:hypothetical protein
MFARVVERMRGDESYYPAMGHELRSGNYPTASVFNWRAPALYVSLAAAPRWLSFALMAALSILLLASFMIHLARDASPEGTVIGLVLAAGAVVTLADRQGRWLTEAWAGVLIGVSIAAYLWRAWIPGALAGTAALFLRELAAPYCITCVLLAVRGHRKRELLVWAGGTALFALYYAAHAASVLAEMRAGDLAHPRSWLQFGGLPFWLATIKANALLFSAPRVVLSVSSVLLLAALWAPSLPPHVRAAVVAYGLFFAVAGQPFNDYWGFVSSLIYALALSHGPAGLWTLVSRVMPQRAAGPSGE